MTAAPPPAPPSRRRLASRRTALLAAGVLAAAGLALLALVPLQYAALAQQGFDDACRNSVGGLPIDQGALVGGYWSWWPLGGACEWTSLDGTVLVDLPDWSTTAVAITGGALLLGGLLALALVVLRRPRR